MLPSVFVSHGSPMLPLGDSPARRFLADLASHLPRPEAVLAVSAHWETWAPTVNSVVVNDTIHDFRGFPEPLYALRYPAPGSPALAERVCGLLRESGFECRVDPRRGIDHGAWVPLLLTYPKTDIPVVQLSVQSRLGPAHHFDLGRALAPLRDDILILGSGSFTHNLHEYFGGAEDGTEPEWVSRFADWFDRALAEGRTQDLLDYRRLAPAARRNHPTEERLLPLFVALGAAGPRPHAQRLHRSADRGVLRLDAYAFEGNEARAGRPGAETRDVAA